MLLLEGGVSAQTPGNLQAFLRSLGLSAPGPFRMGTWAGLCVEGRRRTYGSMLVCARGAAKVCPLCVSVSACVCVSVCVHASDSVGK